MTLKTRQPGQGGVADPEQRDLRAELLKAEAAHFAKKKGIPAPNDDDDDAPTTAKRQLEAAPADDGAEGDETPEVKRRRLILEEARDLDADSDGSSSESSEEEDDDDDDEEDETAELMRELEKIKRERAEQKAKEEAEKAAEEEEEREYEIARGNPLLNPKDFNVKRRWDDDVVFKNQARGTDDKKPKEFVNDLLRSDFHRRFMVSRLLRTTLSDADLFAGPLRALDYLNMRMHTFCKTTGVPGSFTFTAFIFGVSGRLSTVPSSSGGISPANRGPPDDVTALPVPPTSTTRVISDHHRLK